MTRDELVNHAEAVARLFDAVRTDSFDAEFSAAHSQASEFLRRYGGPDNEFLAAVRRLSAARPHSSAEQGAAIVRSFREFVATGLMHGISPEDAARLEVVSDYLDQARLLLDDAALHPAAAVVVAGATLEQFLCTWCERERVTVSGRATIATYAQTLRSNGLITKQDEKEVTSWAGLRNSAAHGDWTEVSDRARARLMIDGISLFMRRNTPS